MNRKLRSLILMFLAVFMVTALSLTVSAEGRDRSKEKVPAGRLFRVHMNTGCGDIALQTADGAW